jgi:hypothetical protein
MAFPSITDFKEQLLDGGARPSLFEMNLTFPAGVLATAAALVAGPAMFKTRFHCRISEIPGTQHNPISLKFAGREIKYAGQRVFNNITLTILNDEAFSVRRGLEAWFEAMNTRESNKSKLSSPTSGGYAGIGEVFQYNKKGDKIRGYRFVDLFPVTLAPIALDWSNDGAIEDYTCEFAYQYWEPSINVGGGAFDKLLDPVITL